MLKTKVKASQVTNLTDGRYFAAWEVEWIGFNLELGAGSYIEPQKLKEIRNWLEGPKYVGEFGLTDAATIRATAEFLALDAIQLNHFADLATVKSLADIPIIKEVLILKDGDNANLLATLKTFESSVEAFLLDFTKAGISWEAVQAGTYLEYETLKAACQNHKIILSVDYSEENVNTILETLQPFGINLTGGEEEKVGFKNFDDIDEIIEAIYYEE
jgi:phosphoribosylanthranilate isomerase